MIRGRLKIAFQKRGIVVNHLSILVLLAAGCWLLGCVAASACLASLDDNRNARKIQESGQEACTHTFFHLLNTRLYLRDIPLSIVVDKIDLILS